MTNEQKRFKIRKIESYEKQISQENKNSTEQTYLLGLAAAAALCTFSAAANANTNVVVRIIDILLGSANTVCSAYQLKLLIESISRKTNLQSKVEDIKSELEMSKNEESRVRKR